MARKLIILAKFLLFLELLFVKIKEEEWAVLLRPYGKAFSLGEKFSAFSTSLLHFLIIALGLNLLVIFLAAIYRRRKKLPRDKKDNVLLGLDNVYILLMTGLVIVGILSLFGVDQKNLFTGLSIVAAAIAIITKDYVANIISGIAISFSSEISIDDYIKIGDLKGKVIDISISRLALLNDDDDVIFIPNNTVFISNIINYTKKGIRKVSIEFEMNIANLDTIESLENDLIDSLSEFHKMIEEQTFKLKVVEIHKDHLQLKFQFVLHEMNREMERQIRRKTVRRVVDHIRRESK